MSVVVRCLLLPFSLLYAAVVVCRNLLFDWGILKSRQFDVPVISVGNLTVGGTGKTPHIEYLIRLLEKNNRLAMLSRGYMRQSKGFVLAGEHTTVMDVGDEPHQIARKFSNVRVAVDAERVRGIECLLRLTPSPNCILLDDAFQHRYVKPGLSILLVDYNRPVYNDWVMPAGRLREPLCGRKRADVVVVSKCPVAPEQGGRDLIAHRLKLRPHQMLVFSGFQYGQLQTVFAGDPKILTLEEYSKQGFQLVLVTGIANPQPLVDYVKKYFQQFIHIKYPDHHHFNSENIAKIASVSGKHGKILLLTTEKDAVRLRLHPELQQIEAVKAYIPVEVLFYGGDSEKFNRKIIDYVEQNK